MIIFNCTKAAEDYLFPKESKKAEKSSDTSTSKFDFEIEYRGEKEARISQWLVTHSKVGAQNILFVCHATHRFTITLTEIKKGDVDEFLFIVFGRLLAQFVHWQEAMPFSVETKPEQWIVNYINAHKGNFFRRGRSASLQSTIKRVKEQLENDFHDIGRLPNNEVEGTYFDIEGNLQPINIKKSKQAIIPAYELFNEFLSNYMDLIPKDIIPLSQAAESVMKISSQKSQLQAHLKQITTPYIFQLKIQLLDFTPTIWRRFTVPSTMLLSDLHQICQIVMGWENDHLYQFKKNKKWIDNEDEDVLLATVLASKKDTLTYYYDFGDSWEHKITLEKILPFDEKNASPLCIEGEKACPPEDCGGVWGYEELLDILSDPEHNEYEERFEWFGEELDPDFFDVKAINKQLKRKIKKEKERPILFRASELIK